MDLMNILAVLAMLAFLGMNITVFVIGLKGFLKP